MKRFIEEKVGLYKSKRALYKKEKTMAKKRHVE
jgi:hypothetical protein